MHINRHLNTVTVDSSSIFMRFFYKRSRDSSAAGVQYSIIHMLYKPTYRLQLTFNNTKHESDQSSTVNSIETYQYFHTISNSLRSRSHRASTRTGSNSSLNAAIREQNKLRDTISACTTFDRCTGRTIYRCTDNAVECRSTYWLQRRPAGRQDINEHGVINSIIRSQLSHHRMEILRNLYVQRLVETTRLRARFDDDRRTIAVHFACHCH